MFEFLKRKKKNNNIQPVEAQTVSRNTANKVVRTFMGIDYEYTPEDLEVMRKIVGENIDIPERFEQDAKIRILNEIDESNPQIKRMKELNEKLCGKERFGSLKNDLNEYMRLMQSHMGEMQSLTNNMFDKINDYIQNNNIL